jgi:enoyl-CoA hydratase/carnithine racemase
MPVFERIIYEQKGPIVKITLNRPEKLNALDDPMMLNLGAAFDFIQQDESVRVLIVTGAGRAFSAGYDLSPREKPLVSVQDWRDHMTRTGRDVIMKMWDLRVPVIAAVRGYALGGGCDIVLMADIAILAEDAKLGEPEVRHVSCPTFIMPWVIGMKKTKELLLTGDSIDAQEAYRLGAANKIVPVEKLDEEAWAFAERIAKIPPVSIEYNKRAINHAFEVMGIKNAIAYGVEIFPLLLLTEESAEFGKAVAKMGLKAALEARDSGFVERTTR